MRLYSNLYLLQSILILALIAVYPFLTLSYYYRYKLDFGNFKKDKEQYRKSNDDNVIDKESMENIDKQKVEEGDTSNFKNIYDKLIGMFRRLLLLFSNIPKKVKAFLITELKVLPNVIFFTLLFMIFISFDINILSNVGVFVLPISILLAIFNVFILGSFFTYLSDMLDNELELWPPEELINIRSILRYLMYILILLTSTLFALVMIFQVYSYITLSPNVYFAKSFIILVLLYTLTTSAYYYQVQNFTSQNILVYVSEKLYNSIVNYNKAIKNKGDSEKLEYATEDPYNLVADTNSFLSEIQKTLPSSTMIFKIKGMILGYIDAIQALVLCIPEMYILFLRKKRILNSKELLLKEIKRFYTTLSKMVSDTPLEIVTKLSIWERIYLLGYSHKRDIFIHVLKFIVVSVVALLLSAIMKNYLTSSGLFIGILTS